MSAMIQPPRFSANGLKGLAISQWFCLLLGLFLLIRGGTTFAMGVSFDRPGDGWRALFQVVIGAYLLISIMREQLALRATAVIAVIYGIEAIVGNIDGNDIFGLIPVDMRDKIVHPTIFVLALTIVLVSRYQRAQSTGR